MAIKRETIWRGGNTESINIVWLRMAGNPHGGKQAVSDFSGLRLQQEIVASEN
jgi:hypothetical protein